MAILDAEARVVMANAAFCSLLGYSEAAVAGMALSDFYFPAALGAVGDVGTYETSPDAAPRVGTHHLARRDGTSVWADVDVRQLPMPAGDATAMVIIRDSTQLREQTERLAMHATTDVHTGLLNREYFQRSLTREIARCQRTGTRLALVWIDADLFKEVNDHYGHAAGDEVLRISAERLESAVRVNDVVGRIGGDEFGVVLTRYEGEGELDTVLERMLRTLRVPILVGEDEVRISGSLGVAIYPDDGETTDALMHAADAAMYSVKSGGGDGFEYFEIAMRRAAEARRLRRSEIEAALRDQAFALHYQPIVTVEDGSLWGIEALIRWKRDHETVPAAEFIDFCEHSGQIRALAPLTLALIRHDLNVLRQGGHDFGKACINVSVSQLEQRGLHGLATGWPDDGGLRSIVIEVTESVLLPERGRAVDALATLTGLGAEVSVDDFGSGYSNFALLESLAPAYIKLDKSFLAAHAERGLGRALLSSAVEMAHALQSTVIAEGVESEEHIDMVAELGVDLMQGYAIARPMPLSELIEWIEARRSIEPA